MAKTVNETPMDNRLSNELKEILQSLLILTNIKKNEGDVDKK